MQIGEIKMVELKYSRYDDPTPIKCGDCGWEGQVKDCIHNYAPILPDDVEPMDYCPICKGMNLIPAEQVENDNSSEQAIPTI